MVTVLNYKEAAAYIEEIPKFTRKHALEHTREFLRWLGNPAEDRKVIHVAGTNGKGSVCAYIQAILKSEGKRVGLFTSPHLVSVNERIRIDGVPITERAFADIFEVVKRTAVKMKEEGFEHPSYFEFLYGMGMKAFAQSDVEYIILETGLGGRLDATNSFPSPCVSVITSVSLDHMDILGDTIEKIAGEKAGIIRRGVPVIFDGSDEKASEVIRKTAKERGATCREISKNAFEIQEVTRKTIAFSRTNAYDKGVVWTISQSGIYQVMNAVIAMETAEYVLRNEVIHKSAWKEALEAVQWEGRMEEARPHLFIDGAHNIGAVEAFADSMELMCLRGMAQPVILFSAVEDKNYEQMIACLSRRIAAKAFIITEIADGRKASAERLCSAFRKYITEPDKKLFCETDIKKAIELAFEIRGDGDIFCLGSLYLAGMIKSML